MINIIGYENYTISDEGVVLRSNGKPKSFFDNNGYKCVTLYKDAKGKVFYVHRLVAVHYIPNPLNKPCVNHLDFNRANNVKSNLEWCTYSENEIHKIENNGIEYKTSKRILPKSHHDFIIDNYKKLSIEELSESTGCSPISLRSYMRGKGLYYYKGFSYEKSRNKYKSVIWIDGKSKLIGRFDTQKEAEDAYTKAKFNLKKQ